MKALVIAPQPFFSPRGTPFSVYYRTLVTAELGVTVDLLTYGQGADVDIPGVRIIRIPRLGIRRDIKIGPSLLKLFLDGFLFLKTVALLVRRRYHFVHAHEEAVFWCLLLKPLFRFQLIYDMHSSLPQQLLNFQFTRSKILIGVFERLESAALRRSEAVIAICPDLHEHAREKMSGPSRLFLIENSLFDPIRLAESKPESAPPSLEKKLSDLPAGKKRLVYAGTLEPYQGIDVLLGALQILVKEKVPVVLLIVGGREEQVTFYSRQAGELQVSEAVVFTGQVSKARASDISAEADLLISPRTSGTNTPLKIYEQLASGIPLVATNIRSHTQVLSEEVAFLVNPTPSAMAQGIKIALQSRRLAADKVKRAQLLYRQRYSREQYRHKMQLVLKELG